MVNQKSDITAAAQVAVGSPALLHEMMRSFTILAQTLNLSQAVEELGSTRQTVRRHITQLEAAMGCKLFNVENRRYALSDAGVRALAPAERLIDQSEVWYSGRFDTVDGMMRFSYDGEDGIVFRQQEQPISAVWSGKSELLRTAIKAWAASEGRLEAEELQIIRPYILGYRKIDEGWICVEVGEESYFSNWYGWTQARSSVGRNLNQFPGGRSVATIVNAPFREISANAGVRLDQVMTRLQLTEGGAFEYAMFDRLLFGVRLPDESPAIISVVDRSCEVRIAGVEKSILEEVPARASVRFER